MNRNVAFGIVALAAILGVSAMFGSWYTINQGERGVRLRNGAVIGIAEPGLGFMTPFVDHVEHVDVQQHSRIFDKMEAYSQDQQPANLRVSVNYNVPADRVTDLYVQYGSIETMLTTLVDRIVPQQTKIVFGQFNAALAIQNRAKLNIEVADAIAKAIAGPVAIVSVQIEDIKFSAAYENSIEQRMLAEVEVQKLQQNAEREKVQAQITVTQATAKADAVRAAATADAAAVELRGKADADVIQLRGTAEANVITLRGQALKDNAQLIALTQAERWDGKLPTTMIPGGTVPFLGLGTPK